MTPVEAMTVTEMIRELTRIAIEASALAVRLSKRRGKRDQQYAKDLWNRIESLAAPESTQHGPERREGK